MQTPFSKYYRFPTNFLFDNFGEYLFTETGENDKDQNKEDSPLDESSKSKNNPYQFKFLFVEPNKTSDIYYFSFPGIDKKDIEVRVNKNKLTVKAKHPTNDTYAFEETFKGVYNIRPEDLKVVFYNGLLMVTYVKTENKDQDVVVPII